MFSECRKRCPLRAVKLGLLLLSIGLLFSVPLFAQQGLSTMRGTVTDPSGAVVPKASISLLEQETGVLARKVTSDAQGNYEIPALKLSTYRMRIEMTGF